MRSRHLEQQTDQAWCLTVANDRGGGLVDRVLRRARDRRDARQGRHITPEVLAHISPAHSENVNFFGSITVDVDHELAQLGPTGYRPLREPTPSDG